MVSTVCCALGIADFNTPVRRYHVERAKAYLDLAYELEGRNLLLVLGEYIWQQEVIAPRDQWKWAVEHVRDLGEYAAGLGLEIAIELEPFHLSLVNDLPKMIQFLDDVAHPAVKANLDVSHLALAQPRRRRSPGWRAASRTSTFPIATARSTATCRPAAAWSISRPICRR